MKNLLYFVVVVLLYFDVAHAENWMSESDILKANAGLHGISSEIDRRKCSEPCQDITSKDLRRMSVQDVQEDDPEKPLYGPKLKSVVGLADLGACQAMQSGHCDDLNPGYTVRAVCSPSYELYCVSVAPQSYGQHTVRKVALDSSLVAVADAADLAKDAVVQARVDRKARLQAAKGNIPSMTPLQRDALLQDLLEQSLE